MLQLTRKPGISSRTAFHPCSRKVYDGYNIMLFGLWIIFIQKVQSVNAFLSQRKWPAVSKVHMLSGRMAKFWILVQALQLIAESDLCALDVPGQSSLICYSQFLEAKLKLFFGGYSNGPLCFPRLCSDGEEVHLYHTTDNSRVYHKEELKSLEIPAQVNEKKQNRNWSMWIIL